MTKDEFETIGAALRNISGIMAERIRQESQGATAPFTFFHDSLTREGARLRVNGAPALGDAVTAFRDEVQAMDNE